MTLNEKQQEFVNACTKMFPSKDTLDNAELLSVSKSLGMNFKPQWLVRNPELRVGRGSYKIPTNGEVPTAAKITMPNVLNDTATDTPTIPKVAETTKVSEAAYIVSSLIIEVINKYQYNLKMLHTISFFFAYFTFKNTTVTNAMLLFLASINHKIIQIVHTTFQN